MGAGHDKAGYQPLLEPAGAARAQAEWEEGEYLLTVWLGTSAGSMLLSVTLITTTFGRAFLPGGLLGMVAGAVGVLGGVLALGHGCNSGVAAAVQATRFLALITAALSYVMSVLMVSLGVGFLRERSFLWGEAREVSTELTKMFCMHSLWFALYAGLSVVVARRAAEVRRVLREGEGGAIAPLV